MLEDFAVDVGDVGRASEVIGVVEILVFLEHSAAGVVVTTRVSVAITVVPAPRGLAGVAGGWGLSISVLVGLTGQLRDQT